MQAAYRGVEGAVVVVVVVVLVVFIIEIKMKKKQEREMIEKRRKERHFCYSPSL